MTQSLEPLLLFFFLLDIERRIPPLDIIQVSPLPLYVVAVRERELVRRASRLLLHLLLDLGLLALPSLPVFHRLVDSHDIVEVSLSDRLFLDLLLDQQKVQLAILTTFAEDPVDALSNLPLILLLHLAKDVSLQISPVLGWELRLQVLPEAHATLHIRRHVLVGVLG